MTTTRQSVARARAIYWLLPAVTLAAFLPALRGGFVWDDDGHVTRPDLQSLAGLGRIWTKPGSTQQYYPLLHTLFWWEHRWWGDEPFGYHLATLLLHCVAACLVVAVVRKLRIPGSSLSGLLFALHPVAAESVAWISEQKNTLSAVFCLSAALAYLQFDAERDRPGSHRWRWYAAGLTLFVLALLSKSVTATLPAVLLVVLWWREGRLRLRRHFVPLAPWLALGILSGGFTAWAERHYIGATGPAFQLGIAGRCLLAGRALWFYFGKLVWPSHLAFVYPRWSIDAHQSSQYLPCAAAAAVLAAAWSMRRVTRGPLAAALIFCGTLFPVLGFFNVYPFLFSYVADHFQYLARLAVIVPVCALAARARWKASAAVAVAAFAALTWTQALAFRDNESLFRASVRQNPGAWMAWDQLGEAADRRGDHTGAIADYRQALHIEPNLHETRNYLGNALRSAGRLGEAIAQYREALRVSPDYPPAHNNLGVALMEQGNLGGAEHEFQAALRLWPVYPDAENNFGVLLSRERRYADAAAHLRRALAERPDYAEAGTNLRLVQQQAKGAH